MENIEREPSRAYGTVHGPGYSGTDSISSFYTLPNNQSLANDFHVYAAGGSNEGYKVMQPLAEKAIMRALKN